MTVMPRQRDFTPEGYAEYTRDRIRRSAPQSELIRLLRDMTVDGQPPPATSEIVARLDRKPSYEGVVRRVLRCAVSAGLIVEVDRPKPAGSESRNPTVKGWQLTDAGRTFVATIGEQP